MSFGEAQNLHIVTAPLHTAIRTAAFDMPSPVYGLLLHAATAVFGDDANVARSFSLVCSVASLALLWHLGRGIAGRSAAMVAVLLFTTNPFVFRAATEIGPSALAMTMALGAWAAAHRSIRRPSATTYAVTAILTSALVLTTAWGAFIAGAGILAIAIDRNHPRMVTRRSTIIAVTVGMAAALPWVATFVPDLMRADMFWGRPEWPIDAVTIMLTAWGGGRAGEAQLLGAGLGLFTLIGLLGTRTPEGAVELGFPLTSQVRSAVLAAGMAIAFATVASAPLGVPFSTRNTAALVPVAIIATSYALSLFPGRARAVILTGFVLLGAVGVAQDMTEDRSQAAQIASAVTLHARSGDFVVFCPDQLGPAIVDDLPAGVRPMGFPDGTVPAVVSWRGYRERIRAADVTDFARAVDERSAGHAIWLVAAGGYRGFGDACGELIHEFERNNGTGAQLVLPRPEITEGALLIQFPPL